MLQHTWIKHVYVIAKPGSLLFVGGALDFRGRQYSLDLSSTIARWYELKGGYVSVLEE